MTHALYVSVFVIATCGLVYELVAGALASYLLGDTITQFSTVIGTYLCAMGLGSYLSRFVVRGLVARFVIVETLVGLVGGFSAVILFLTFAYTGAFQLVLYLVVVAVGVLVGLEIPLLLRILKDRVEFKDLVAQVLSLDYVGALAASLAFPLVLLPRVGLIRSAFLFGIANAAIALWSTWIFAPLLGRPGLLRAQCAAVLALLVGGLAASDHLTTLAEASIYADEVILARSSPYQRIVLTRWRDDLRLYLNGHLQFSSRDEHRYHEALVHPALAAVPAPRRALVLGGGDGLAIREILRYPEVEHVQLVDIDAVLTDLFRGHPLLVAQNGGALSSPRVTLTHADALAWMAACEDVFDLIVVDLPDPTTFSLGKLYTTSFYRLLARHLSEQGLAAVQATSPMFARRSYWSIVETLRAAGLCATPYHAYVPAFGEWGFVIASRREYQRPVRLPAGLRFLTPEVLASMFVFPPDMARAPPVVNRLDNQALVHLYESEWREITK